MLKKIHQDPEMMKGQAMVGIGPSSTKDGSIVTLTFSSVKLDLPQISSASSTPLSGRNGRTRNVAARKPAPIRAWNNMVKGLDFSGPKR